MSSATQQNGENKMTKEKTFWSELNVNDLEPGLTCGESEKLHASSITEQVETLKEKLSVVLERENKLRAKLECLEVYLSSTKFAVDTTVQTSDVLARLEEIRLG